MRCRSFASSTAMAAAFTAGVALSAQMVDLDFEAGFEGWTKPQPNWSLVEGAGRNGSRGFAWTGVDTNLYQIASGTIPFKPGERIRVTGWILDENLEGGEPGFCVEFYDQNGYLDGAGSKTVGETKERKGKWVQYEVRTDPAPAAATRCSIDLFVKKGVTGRCIYDDFVVEKIGREENGLFFSSAPNDRAADGRVRFVATTYADLRPYKPGEVKAFFMFAGETGEFRVEPESFEGGRAETLVDVRRLKLGAHKVRFVVQTKTGKELYARAMTFTRLAVPDCGKVWFDEHRRMIVDGKPTYPILVYSHFDSIRDPRFVSAMKSSPFKMTMCYSKKANKPDLDYLQANGLKAFVSVYSSFAHWPWANERPEDINAVDEEVAHTVRVVSGVRDHPALLGWYLYDEPKANLMPRLRERYKLIKELDPDHPCMIVLNTPIFANNTVSACDILGLDCYPVPGAGTEKTKPADLGSVSRVTRDAISLIRREKPFWFVPQAYPHEPEFSRFPTVREMSSMVWQAVAEGADGILFYAINEMLRRKENPGYCFEEAWRVTCTVAQQLRDREEFLLSTEPPPAIAGLPNGVVARAWRLGGRTLLVVVNTTHDPIIGELTMDGRTIKLDLGPDETVFF